MHQGQKGGRVLDEFFDVGITGQMNSGEFDQFQVL
jgi:hypothetical protein